MKIIIPSYGRPGTIKTHLIFDKENIPYKIVLHNNDHKREYIQNPTIKESNIIVSHTPKGLAAQRNWIIDNLVSKGEWVLMLDDNISEFTAVKPSIYNKYSALKKGSVELCDENFRHKIGAKTLIKLLSADIEISERLGYCLIGMASNENHFFRSKKYREVGYVLGKTSLVKKTELRYDTRLNVTEDYFFSALNMVEKNGLLVNNWLKARCKHYEAGGVGPLKDRMKGKVAQNKILMEWFSGMFKYVEKKDHDKGAEINFRITTKKQLENWKKRLTGKNT